MNLRTILVGIATMGVLLPVSVFAEEQDKQATAPSSAPSKSGTPPGSSNTASGQSSKASQRNGVGEETSNQDYTGSPPDPHVTTNTQKPIVEQPAVECWCVETNSDNECTKQQCVQH